MSSPPPQNAPFPREALLEWTRRAAARQLGDLSWVELNPSPKMEPYRMRRTRRGAEHFIQGRYGRTLPPALLRAIAAHEMKGGASLLQAITLSYAVPEWLVQARGLLWTELTPVPSILEPMVEAYGIGSEIHRGDGDRLLRLRARLPAWHKRRGQIDEAVLLLRDAVQAPPAEDLSGLSSRTPPPPDVAGLLPDAGPATEAGYQPDPPALTGPSAEVEEAPAPAEAEPEAADAAPDADARPADAEEPSGDGAEDRPDDDAELLDGDEIETAALAPITDPTAVASDEDAGDDATTPDAPAPDAPGTDDASPVEPDATALVPADPIAPTAPPKHPLVGEVLSCRSLAWWARRAAAPEPESHLRISGGYLRFQPESEPSWRLVREDVRVGWTPGTPLSPLATRLLPPWACYRIVAEAPEQS